MSLLRLDVSLLITIGGDDTAYSAMRLEEKADGRIRVVHVPKTIDNDLGLPPFVDTFGYQTARHHGVEIVKNLMVDATDDVALVFRDRHGPEGGPPRARHRQGAGGHAHAHPRGVRRRVHPAEGRGRHPRRGDRRAPQLRPPAGRGGRSRRASSSIWTPRI